MRTELCDELEEFVHLGRLWSSTDCAAMAERLFQESMDTGDPLPARIGRFLEAVLIRSQMGEVSRHLACDIEAIVYPRLWKLLEAVRDGMPDGELRTRLEVMNRRLSRLFVEEASAS